MREVARLVSDSPCSSVLLSDALLQLSAGCGAAGSGRAGAGMSMLGVTWNLPTVTGADWTSVEEEKKFRPLILQPFLKSDLNVSLQKRDDLKLVHSNSSKLNYSLYLLVASMNKKL